MTDILNIQRLQVRYRMPPEAPAARARHLAMLERARERAFDDALARALHRLSIPASEEVCIRELTVPVRLRLHGGEPTLAMDWSEAVARAIEAMIRTGGADRVVRYGSRAHALADMAMGVARGDLQRAWAWHQMGLVLLPPGASVALISPPGAAPGPRSDQVSGSMHHAALPAVTLSLAQAVASLVRALALHPETIVAVLHAVAAAGCLAGLATRIERARWPELARLALIAAGVRPDISGAVLLAPAAAAQQVRAWPQHLATSLLARALRHHAPGLLAMPATRIALSALAVLDADASAFRGLDEPAVRALLGAAASVITGIEDTRPASRAMPADADAAGAHTANDATAGVAKPGMERERLASTADAHAGAGVRADSDSMVPLIDVDTAPAPGADSSQDSALVARRTGHTTMAGLLFLVRIIDACGLIDEMRASMAERSLRWILHQLAMALTGAAPGDAAALALAGLPPDAVPPSAGDAAPAPGEQASLASWCARIRAALQAHLPAVASADSPDLIDFVCRRHARIVFDPGWLEAHLSLDEVSTEIRRAGLDLDPGWVPWLGVVMRFVYA